MAWGRVLEGVYGSGAGFPGALQWGKESRESQGNVRVPVYRVLGYLWNLGISSDLGQLGGDT